MEKIHIILILKLVDRGRVTTTTYLLAVMDVGVKLWHKGTKLKRYGIICLLRPNPFKPLVHLGQKMMKS
jgi:hypothetical protein